VLAEAIVRIGEKMELPERRSWYRMAYPDLLSYHKWLYRERDPHEEGLTLQIHPWETGLDTNPAWMGEMHEHLLPWWIGALKKTHLDTAVGLFRRDHLGGIRPRYSTVDALTMFDAQRRLRRKEYNIDKILSHSLFAIEDLAFNAIFIRANDHLLAIAKSIRADVPEWLQKRIQLSRKAFGDLWDPYSETYYCRDFVTHKLIKEPTVAALLPLYAGCISEERAALLVKTLENDHIFGPNHPVPSTPLNSPWFDPYTYWQGPTWLNTNWLIADGLKRYGYKHHAAALIESSLDLVQDGNFHEYFNPITGEALGAPNFSWTAAVVLDWIRSEATGSISKSELQHPVNNHQPIAH
jgi:glycogen debranching enzyme